MALIDKASLLMVPSTYEAGTLYNVLPSGNRAPDETGSNSGYDQTRADFTFDRGTNAAATRVNSDGLIEKYRENLLLQSNQFDTTWSKGNSSVTSGQSGYDGSNDAWLLENISGSSAYVKQDKVVNGVQTASAYAKSGNVDYVYLRLGGSSSRGLYVNLSNGTIHNIFGTLIDYNVDSVGNGWYRISVTYEGNHTNFRIYPSASGGTSTSLGDNIYIQNAQLETGLVATDYLDSGATTAKAGVLVDLPRINYDANGENGALLLEPSRQQLFEFSEYLGASSWSKDNITLTTNDSQSPEGVNNASLIYPTATQSSSPTYIYNSTSGASSKYTISAFVKADGKDVCWLYISSSSTYGIVYFDLSDESIQVVAGSASTPTGTIASAGNGWYRITATLGAAAAIASGAGLGISDVKGNWAVTKNGEDGVLVYGMQIEAGSHVSSYIPNHGTSGGVTRSKDFFVMNLISKGITTASQTEATLFIEFEKPNTGENVDLMRFRGTGALGRGFIYNTAAGFASDWGSSQQINIGGGDNNKVAWRLNSLTSGTDFINGTKGVGSTGTAWSDIRELRFNAEGGGGVLKIKQIALFNTALTDAECITLTTL